VRRSARPATPNHLAPNIAETDSGGNGALQRAENARISAFFAWKSVRSADAYLDTGAEIGPQLGLGDGENQPMKKYLTLLVMTLTAFAVLTQTADAHKKRARVTVYKADNRLDQTSLGLGAASTGAYFAAGATTAAGLVSTPVCVVLAPIVGTVVVKRELTMREAHVMFGSCVIPIIGGYLVNWVWDTHPEWTPAPKPVRTARR
jgi:hypothetical protein